jgi:hypothetical protein
MTAPFRGTVLAGLGNQTRREAAMWWATPRWWRQALVWTAGLGALLVAMLWVLPAVLAGVEGAEVPRLTPTETAGQFAELALVLTAVGVVILSQGLLLDDQRGGLLEWLLSKPLSRPAPLLLAKLSGHSSGLLVAAVAIPWIAVWAVLSIALGEPWPLTSLVATAVLAALFAVFHVVFVLALSVLTGSRGAVLAIPLALLVGGDLIVAVAPWAANISPYLLPRLAAGLLVTGDLLVTWPVFAVVGWAAALLAIAIWSFGRQEVER